MSRFYLPLLLLAPSLLFGEEVKEAPAEIDFEQDIYPLIVKSCLDCHKPPYQDERGRHRFPEAFLVVTTKRALLEGGEDGEVIIPGKPEESEFLLTTLLPIDDDEHMPPKDKAPEWTKAEKDLVRRWIAEGAKFGDWEGDPKYPDPKRLPKKDVE